MCDIVCVCGGGRKGGTRGIEDTLIKKQSTDQLLSYCHFSAEEAGHDDGD